MLTQRRIAGLLLSSLLMCSGIAAAQMPGKVIAPLRGTIDQVSDSSLQLTDRKGEKVSVKLNDQTKVLSVSKGSTADIKPDSFIGTAAVPQADGSLKALEVHVFAASLRGSGEGHSPWQSADGKVDTMTNGTVGKLVNANGRTLTVNYNNQQKTVIVPDGTPIVTLDPGDRSLLKPGAHIVLFSATDDKGERVATRISAGKDGTVPPM
ncbi:Uncharacterised protein [Serratia rubidaea]|uniref:Uncharacterized protein n=1 Tax=Serratia rubidaea TaxID=61652 RepID=A0A4V6YXX3_SERRU|nr:DUF5666 domain-containing protein [Serratia rubidaea]MBD8455095.1 hypothetical protein [Serratia rubidaea]MBS0974094.1 hypothetical protein [Serratia rubidaea]MDC6109512.1 DUF5666 domain-containing protein [Serratia rubidaea]QPR64085.1 hypothetical protein I6G83_02140 [Serratia rubidaea]UJD81607.1 hypothetical protein FS596_18600 [Serratia rubidaea]